MPLEMRIVYQEWPYKQVFKFARETRQFSPLFVVLLSDGEYLGRGECGIQSLKEETPSLVAAELAKIASCINEIGTREALNRVVPARSWRNAVDCAFWDLESKRSQARIWDLAGLSCPGKFDVDLTIGISATDKMRLEAVAAVSRGYHLLKIKSDAQGVLEKVGAISRAVPSAQLIVDANEAWSLEQLQSLTERLQDMNVVLIEQPLHHESDAELANFDSPVPICADESCTTSARLEMLAERYDAINIKLDKTGGLTEALALARGARDFGLRLMMGCNGATSLGNAPAFVVGSLCDWRDIDSQEMLLEDRPHGMLTRNGELYTFGAGLWG